MLICGGLKKLKIAGTNFKTEEDEEIEDILRVSLIAIRMKNLPYKRKIHRKTKEIKMEISKDINERMDFRQDQSSLFSVRGFN